MTFYAHSRENEPPEQWQLLDDHLNNVAELAATFAKPFGAEDWGRIAGLWHDVGKASEAFQKKLNGELIKVVHSAAGGHLAQQKMTRGMERIFCWLIMGHHSGLADFSSSQSGLKALEPKMRNPEKSNPILNHIPHAITSHPVPKFPEILHNGGDISFFVRMLFSCLVDADFLDTENFMDERRNRIRRAPYPSLGELLAYFDEYVENLCRNAKQSEVNKIRAEILSQCRAMADRKPSIFSLTVPTGGGKTLSSLAFALRHAVKYGKRRIIYVIPYTSIIEQTAREFRKIPGFGDAVLEHHCNIVDADDQNEDCSNFRLATENWDIPIVVTTAVQFLESLYACKTSRCRKLHNISNSIVIFDEAQCLPPKFLRPSVFAIRELHRHYGVTPVLCTATQPVLTQTERFDFKFREGFDSVVEIIDNPANLTENLKRVKIEVLDALNPVSYEAVSGSILHQNQSVLCILNRKADARNLSRLLPAGQTLHLSTNMCAEHRCQVLETIFERLRNDSSPLFVVSTSLVEAGVDLDFPVVYRALAGLDSIAQAAGRCNREGKLSHLGQTVVFVPEKQPDYVQSPASLARSYLDEDELSKIFLPETFRSYFGQRFFQLGEDALDKEGILNLLDNNLEFNFRTAAERFRLIDDDWQVPLIVPFEKAGELLDTLREWNARSTFRKLQRYTISIPKNLMFQLLTEGAVRELLPEYPGVFVLDDGGLYTEYFGFTPPSELEAYDTESMMI